MTLYCLTQFNQQFATVAAIQRIVDMSAGMTHLSSTSPAVGAIVPPVPLQSSSANRKAEIHDEVTRCCAQSPPLDLRVIFSRCLTA